MSDPTKLSTRFQVRDDMTATKVAEIIGRLTAELGQDARIDVGRDLQLGKWIEVSRAPERPHLHSVPTTPAAPIPRDARVAAEPQRAKESNDA